MFSYPSLIRKHTNSSYSEIGTRKIEKNSSLLPEEIIRFSSNDSYAISHYWQRGLTCCFSLSFFFADQLMYTLIFFKNVKIFRNIANIHVIPLNLCSVFDTRSYIVQGDFKFTG